MDRKQRISRYYVVFYQRQYKVVRLTDQERIDFGLDRLQVGPAQGTREEAESLKQICEFGRSNGMSLRVVVN